MGSDVILDKGFSKTRLYKIYYQILSRCYKPYNINYKRYGAKGIKMCKEWKNSYANFYNWAIKNGYSESLTIDRIDGNLGYSPENCRWVTYKEQNNNRCSNVYFVYQGKRKTMMEWSEQLGISYTTLQKRYARFGNNPEKIFSNEGYKDIYIEYNGQNLPIIEWSKITGLSRNTIYKRVVQRKWDIEKALTTPLGCTVGKHGMKKVCCLETGEIFNSIADAGKYINRNSTNIKACCDKRRNTCGGYHWVWA